MTQVVLFTGTSRTDPNNKIFSMQDMTATVLARPLGAYQIASILRDAGYTVQVIDRYHWMIREKGKDFYNEVIRPFIGPETLWVGWSNTFWEGTARKDETDLKNIGYLAEAAKAVGMQEAGIAAMQRFRENSNPNMKFVVGGAKTWRWSQQDFHFFDYYVEGYADVMALELTNYLAGKGPKPATKPQDDGSEILDYDRRGDSFDFVNHVHKWDPSDHINQGEALPIEIARGCIFRCSYCSFPLNGKKKLDFIRDPGYLREELTRNYEEHGVTKYYYGDDTHNDSVKKLEFLYDEVYSKLNFKIEFATYLRLDLLAAHPQTIPLLMESGLTSTFFGIESFNYHANKPMGKAATEEKIYENLYKCKDVWKDKVFIHAGLITGLPNDSEETMMEWGMKATAKDSPIDYAMITELHLFPTWGKDAHWANKMELNPDFYGYTFDEEGIEWTNNKGVTKTQAAIIAKKLLNNLDDNKMGVGWSNENSQNQGWYSFAHAANCGMTTHEYLNKGKMDILRRRESLLDQYYQKLVKGASAEQAKRKGEI